MLAASIRPIPVVLSMLLLFAPAMRATEVHPRFDLSGPDGGPFPSDRFTVADPTQMTGLRVTLPKPDCLERASDCEDIDVINTLDGFDVQPRLSIPFSGAIDVHTVISDTVFLIKLVCPHDSDGAEECDEGAGASKGGHQSGRLGPLHERAPCRVGRASGAAYALRPNRDARSTRRLGRTRGGPTDVPALPPDRARCVQGCPPRRGPRGKEGRCCGTADRRRYRVHDAKRHRRPREDPRSNQGGGPKALSISTSDPAGVGRSSHFLRCQGSHGASRRERLRRSTSSISVLPICGASRESSARSHSAGSPRGTTKCTLGTSFRPSARVPERP